MISNETSGPKLEEIWEEIPEAIPDEANEEKFKVLQEDNQINSKILDIILNAKKECRILSSEKDVTKFYRTNFLDALEEQKIDYKLLTSIIKKSKRIFDGIDKTRIKKLYSLIKENLYFLIKGTMKCFSLLKMKETIKKCKI